MKVAIAVFFVCASVLLAGSDTLYVENDVFCNRDYDYTHGTKLTHEVGDGWYAYLWQGIYTPKDKESLSVVPGDRPYAGWLSIGAEKRYQWKGAYHVTEASAGVVGPLSFSEQSQTVVHELIDDFVPAGWDNQLKNEPAVMLRHEARVAIPIFGIPSDLLGAYVVPQAEVVVGTVMDYVGVGGDLVFGIHPDPYFDNQISVRAPGRKWGLFAFAGVRGRAVAWNMLLDGNMWHDSTSVDSELLVADLQYGVCFRVPQLSLSWTQIERSKEFSTQDGSEKFNAVTLSIMY